MGNGSFDQIVSNFNILQLMSNWLKSSRGYKSPNILVFAPEPLDHRRSLHLIRKNSLNKFFVNISYYEYYIIHEYILYTYVMEKTIGHNITKTVCSIFRKMLLRYENILEKSFILFSNSKKHIRIFKKTRRLAKIKQYLLRSKRIYVN